VADLADRVALVTGGGRGIGRAIALELTDAGAAVAVLARSRQQVEAVAAELSGRGARALAVAADVTDRSAVAAAISEVVDALGPVDVLVNNAGVVEPLGTFLAVEEPDWERCVAINLTAAVRLTRALLPGMLERGFGRLVAITSGAASPPGMPSASAYSVAKAGLEMLSINLAEELRGTGVTSVAVRPGTADTAMQELMRAAPPEQVGAVFHGRFSRLHLDGGLVDPAVPARLVRRLVELGRTAEVIDVRDREAAALLE
jgi:NAD(P)-dependent dehydrogenase (short-subunit alcohol dehydrogenase family)